MVLQISMHKNYRCHPHRNNMEYFAIGLMSGTSLDGLDICCAKFAKNDNWQFQIIHAETIPYNEEWEKLLRNAIYCSAEDLFELNSRYGYLLGQLTRDFIHQYHIKKVDIVSSHGHTVFHQPQKKFTVQIGDGRAIQQMIKLPIAYDFRSQDVIMGGNGAPLVPIGDELLFHEFDACVNLGGFSNISFKKNNQRIAFDISPANIILNDLAQKFGKNYDKNGEIAKNGSVNHELLQQLNSLDYYQQAPPKSLGLEWCINNIFPLIESLDAQTAISTFTEHIAEQISIVINEHNLQNVLFTGGGTFNRFLMETIRLKTNAAIIIPDESIINFKEALIFAFMGILRLRNENNVLSSATGSSQDHCSGILI